MHVLILGANGMLGRALQRAFESDEVVAWDKQELDITQKADVERHLPTVEPDVVINAAAYTDVEKAEDEQDLAVRINGTAVGFVAETCARHGFPLLHVSTDYVFGSARESGSTEDDEPATPLNAYGASKLLGERAVREHAKNSWLVRTSWLFGPHGRHFVDTMLRLGEKQREVRVVSDQHGSPTYAPDLARAIFTLINDEAPFGTYHLTNSGLTTWAEFAKEIFREAGMDASVMPISSAEYPSKVRRPAWSVLKNTKRPPLRHWRDALSDYLNIRHVTHP
jgi:dTDP-4-dehydrorhamnose reductase